MSEFLYDLLKISLGDHRNKYDSVFSNFEGVELVRVNLGGNLLREKMFEVGLLSWRGNLVDAGAAEMSS